MQSPTHDISVSVTAWKAPAAGKNYQSVRNKQKQSPPLFYSYFFFFLKMFLISGMQKLSADGLVDSTANCEWLPPKYSVQLFFFSFFLIIIIIFLFLFFFHKI